MINLKNKFFKSFSFWLFFVFVLNSLANFFFWYSSIKEFDMLMHFLGGFTASLFSFWLIYKKCVLWIEEGNTAKAFRVVLLMVVVIALLWEIMEFLVQDFFGVTVLANIPDSFSDLAFGALGGIIGFMYLLRKYKKERNKDPFKI
ncbi:MAG: hypothetical protein QG654_252 [Patescibacteria group bacterium]|nr:hypothetical protein [Patescibacteria group bacterium]